MDSKTFNNMLADRLGRDAEDVQVVIKQLANVIADQLKVGDSVTVPGFGAFEPKMRSERVATNPASGKKLLVPPKLSVAFKPSALLRQKVK